MNDDDWARYARHLNLDGVGPAGQSRLAAGQATVRSRDLAGLVARRYLEAAGVGRVSEADAGEADASWVSEAVTDASCQAVVAGAVEALAAVRGLLDGGDA